MKGFIKNSKFLMISLGAVPGALIRWQIDQIIIVNLVGCFLLGFVNALNISRKFKLIFCFGFCGSLTTFSGWSFQLFNLIKQGSMKIFFFNMIFVVIFGVFAVGLGHLCAKKIID
tara:strand:+ start:577 stop:921 length:345 start_codon:yes stop_codon:yes gene_type:complete